MEEWTYSKQLFHRICSSPRSTDPFFVCQKSNAIFEFLEISRTINTGRVQVRKIYKVRLQVERPILTYCSSRNWVLINLASTPALRPPWLEQIPSWLRDTFCCVRATQVTRRSFWKTSRGMPIIREKSIQQKNRFLDCSKQGHLLWVVSLICGHWRNTFDVDTWLGCHWSLVDADFMVLENFHSESEVQTALQA